MIIMGIVVMMLFVAFTPSNAGTAVMTNPTPEDGFEAKIFHSWQGDYPVAQLNRLPEKQRELPVAFIDNGRTFENVWKAFKPGEPVPKIDFGVNLVLFARNTHFYNTIRIARVNVMDGVAKVLAMETRSAKPIEDKVGMSMVVVSRKGLKSIRTGEGTVPISGFRP